jgi:coproporphyrinogen III oxidase-like Fe-S oxidoreductase
MFQEFVEMLWCFDVQEAQEAIRIAQRIFPRVSFDLIYARHPQQTPNSWREELKVSKICPNSSEQLLK